ncbi:MAG: 2,3-bisphosphoglycerate-independent phosphoglycerate mutase [Oligoflexia bacterium]|nr:2,3-bisphosphoglycerate-independent phosphoglycerate mutase [Oligoflexia bacterium]
MQTDDHGKTQRAALIILDGFGLAKDSPFNAIRNAKMPFYQELIRKHPHSQLLTHGRSVGLPDGIMGNSEVGHTTIGAGRIVYQDLTRISKAIHDQEFQRNPVLRETIQAGSGDSRRVHLMGLLSDGGVHSTIEHLEALLDLCLELKAPRVSVHAFLDGRDTPPDSSVGYLERLLRHPAFGRNAVLATVTGRYWVMDRDRRWERVEKAYRTLTGQVAAAPVAAPAAGKDAAAAIAAVKRSHADGKTDEFVEPVLLAPEGAMRDGDSVIFFNYRSDRAREITQALTFRDFSEFDRGRGFRPSAYAGMTTYDKTFTPDKTMSEVRVAFPPQNLNHIFGEWLEQHHLSQCRIAETEKYAHVTFFFNGGREKAFEGEDRVLIPSPKEVATYDLKPEMSAFAVAEEATRRIESGKYDFVLMNFANPDMVGHTGNYEAVVRAMEAIDRCLAQVVTTARKAGYHLLITADHGNAEEMRDAEGRLHTQHTLNPVPILWIAADSAKGKLKATALKDGTLEDLMPTLCEAMNLPLPSEVTGKSLLA